MKWSFSNGRYSSNSRVCIASKNWKNSKSLKKNCFFFSQPFMYFDLTSLSTANYEGQKNKISSILIGSLGIHKNDSWATKRKVETWIPHYVMHFNTGTISAAISIAQLLKWSTSLVLIKLLKFCKKYTLLLYINNRDLHLLCYKYPK